MPPREAYASDVLVTIRRSSVTPRITSTTRSMIRRPPSSISALGRPPIRVLLPPAWMTPVTLIATWSHRHRSLTEHAWWPHRAIRDGRARSSRRRPAIDDHVHRALEIPLHLKGGRRRIGAARIRTRRRDR